VSSDPIYDESGYQIGEAAPRKPPMHGFKEALDAVLAHEGGYVNHPDDPGGPTNFGVTQAVYDAYRRSNGRARQHVQNIARNEVEAIYRRQYWDAVKGDDLPPGLSYVVFDGAVNSGPGQSVKWLQRALGMTRVDGVLGQVTMTAIRDWPGGDYDELIARICERRMAFLQALKTWPSFRNGWTRRVADVKKRGQAWAAGKVGPAPTYIPNAGRKATARDAKAAPPRAPGDLATGVGAGSGGISATIDQTRDSLAPLAGSGGWIDTAIAALAITAGVLVIGGLAYRFWASRKTADRADALDLNEFPEGATA
jgi:lysozyme family protein